MKKEQNPKKHKPQQTWATTQTYKGGYNHSKDGCIIISWTYNIMMRICLRSIRIIRKNELKHVSVSSSARLSPNYKKYKYFISIDRSNLTLLIYIIPHFGQFVRAKIFDFRFFNIKNHDLKNIFFSPKKYLSTKFFFCVLIIGYQFIMIKNTILCIIRCWYFKNKQIFFLKVCFQNSCHLSFWSKYITINFFFTFQCLKRWYNS